VYWSVILDERRSGRDGMGGGKGRGDVGWSDVAMREQLV
jgi:hypothetical protein